MNVIILKTPKYLFLMAIHHTKLNKCLAGSYFGFPPILSCITQCLDEILEYTSLCISSIVSLGKNTSYNIVQWLKVLTLDLDGLT